jgi:hypothetical protein
MNYSWYKIKIDTGNPFKENWQFPKVDITRDGIWAMPAKDVFSQEWLSYVSNLGLDLVHTMIFYRGPYCSTRRAHLDLYHGDPFTINNFAINWVIDGIGSEMVWYKMPQKKFEVMWTPANTPYVHWERRELEIIDRCAIKTKMTLVNVGIPHSINVGEQGRWCISVRTSEDDDLPWDQIVEKMRKLNLLTER